MWKIIRIIFIITVLYNINEETKKEKNSNENKDKFNHYNLDEIINFFSIKPK